MHIMNKNTLTKNIALGLVPDDAYVERTFVEYEWTLSAVRNQHANHHHLLWVIVHLAESKSWISFVDRLVGEHREVLLPSLPSS